MLEIIGGGQTNVTIGASNLNDFRKVIIVDPHAKSEKPLGIRIIDHLSSKYYQIPEEYIVESGDNYKRWQVVQTIRD